MSDIIESIKQSAGQVFSELDQKGQIRSAFEGIRSQLSELERRRRASVLRTQIKGLQDQVKQLTEALGLQTLSLFDAGRITHPELSRLCERIGEVQAEIERQKAELAQLEALPKLKCPKCQADVAADAEFCPKCGTRLREAPPQTTATPAPQARTVVRMRCPRCKTILPPDAGFCPTCGVRIKQPQAQPVQARQQQYCPSCGAETSPNAQFCPVCGQAIR